MRIERANGTRRAARAVFAVLRPGGRFAAIVAGDVKRTTYNTIALDLLARHGGKPDWDDKPGSIRSLVNPTKLEVLFRKAGFTDIAVSSLATVQRMASAATVVSMIRDGHAFYKSLIADLPADRQDAAWAELTVVLKRFEGPDGITGPGEINLVVERKPAP